MGLAAVDPAAARADGEGPYFEPSALARSGYDVRLAAEYRAATRTHFAAPVFLFPQPVQRIAAQELRATLDLRLALTHRLALQAVVPLCARFVRARVDGLLVSQTQQLPDVNVELSNVGLCDPTLLIAYRILQSERIDLFVEGGTQAAIADNPGGQTFPQSAPLSTGQSALLLGAGLGVRTGRLQLSAAYRFEFYPGNAATYLIRRVGAQAYTSGSLDSRVAHGLHLQAGYAIAQAVSARLSSEWSVVELPQLVTREGSVNWLSEQWLQEVTVRAELRWQFAAHHALALEYRQPLLASFQDDPFFPIAISAPGVALRWHVAGY